MTTACAKLRADLLISRHDSPEGPYFVLKNPASGRFFRLLEEEYFIAQQLDGSTPLEAVRERVTEQFEVEADLGDLREFVGQLGLGGLLEGDRAEGGHSRRALRGSVLWLRVKAFDPDRLFDWLLPRIGFFFTPYFVVGSAGLVVLALTLTFANHSAIAHDVWQLWGFQSLLLAYLIVFLVIIVHEFAHGLTCKHFGGKVHEIGFLLIYFQPAFYCNISDAYLLPEKSKRLWVTFAGAYIELFLWALATLAWRVTEPGTWPNSFALVVVATSGIKLFFNLNPLIKLDGYYLLVDLLEVPNLRQRAFSFIRASVRRLLARPVAPGALEATPREKRIFWGYGLVALVFSYWLLSVIALRFFGWMTARWQGWGFAMFTVLLITVLWGPLKRGFTRLRDGLVAMRRRPTFGRRWRFAAVLLAVFALLYVTHVQLRVAGEFTLLPSDNADVRAEVEGIIEEVYVDEGSRVGAGDPIARLADREYRARLRMVEADIEERRANLRLLRAGPRQEEVELQRTAVAKADERVRYALSELERLQQLLAIKATSRKDFERAQEEVAVLLKEHEEAQGRLDILLAGSRPEQIAALEQEIERSEAERQRLIDQLERVTLYAAHAGVIVTPKLKSKLGEYVEPGDLVAEVHAVDVVLAEIAVSERDIGEVHVGQRGVLRFRAYPDHSFEGTVSAIAPAAEVDPSGRGGRIVKVKIELENSDGLLKPEMTGYARIYCGKRRALDILT
ncbi:MAG: efflux RND transporter periplasmic adaptor subunit, partial [Gemmatimonadales bacterium]